MPNFDPFFKTDLPSLADVERIYIEKILELTGSQEDTSKILKISRQTLYSKIKKHQIPVVKRRGRKPTKLKNNRRNTGKLPAILLRNGGSRDVTFSVSPEERDYYYNLDFLCGTYKKLIHHGLPLDPELDK